MNEIHDITGLEAMYDQDPIQAAYSIMQWGRQVTDMQQVDAILSKLDLHRLNSNILVTLVHALVHHSQWLTEWEEFVQDVMDHLNHRGEYRLTDKVEMYLQLEEPTNR